MPGQRNFTTLTRFPPAIKSEEVILVMIFCEMHRCCCKCRVPCQSTEPVTIISRGSTTTARIACIAPLARNLLAPTTHLTCPINLTLAYLSTSYRPFNLQAENRRWLSSLPSAIYQISITATYSLCSTQNPFATRTGQLDQLNEDTVCPTASGLRATQHGQRADIAAIPGGHSPNIGTHNTVSILFGNARFSASTFTRGHTEIARSSG